MLNNSQESDYLLQSGQQNVNTFHKSESFHVKSFILMLLAWASFILFMIYVIYSQVVLPPSNGYVLYNATYSEPLPGFEYYWMPFPIIYAIYFAESLLCTCNACVKCGFGASTCAYLRNVKSNAGTENFIANVKCGAPQFQMHVECYHYETHYRTEYYTDSDGNQQSRQVSETRRVVTHTATDYIQYGAWKDCSTNVQGLGQFRVVKIELDKDYEFNDEETYRSFRYQRMHFRRTNDYDVHQDYRESFIIPGYTDFALCCRHGERPCFLHLCYYFLSSIIMLSHPYRVWMEKLSVKTHIDIKKRVSANPLAMQQLPLVMSYQQAGNLAVQTAVVYQELYGVQQPDIPTAVAQALPVATATAVIPTAYAVPVANATHLDEKCTKEQRQQMYSQMQTMQAPSNVNLPVAKATPVAAATPVANANY